MSYALHPAAAHEHRQQIAYYENEQPGLGRRYHAEFKAVVGVVCEAPRRPRIVLPPDVRSLSFKVFHFSIIYREVAGTVQILAVAHHRRQPGYWLGRT